MKHTTYTHTHTHTHTHEPSRAHRETEARSRGLLTTSFSSLRVWGFAFSRRSLCVSFSSVCLYFLVVFQVSFSSSKSSSSKSSGQDVYLLCGSQTGLLFIFGGPSEEIHNQSFRGIRPQKKHSFICLSPRRERERERERKKERNASRALDKTVVEHARARKHR